MVEETANHLDQNVIELIETVSVIVIGITGTPNKRIGMGNEVKKEIKKELGTMIEDQTGTEVINGKDLVEVTEEKTSQKADPNLLAPAINIRKAKRKRKTKAINLILKKK